MALHPHGLCWDDGVTRAVFSSKSCCVVMKSEVFSCCSSPTRLAWVRKESLCYPYVCGLSMSSKVFLYFLELLLALFSNCRCSIPLESLLREKKHCRTPLMIKETCYCKIIFTCVKEYFKTLCAQKNLGAEIKKKSITDHQQQIWLSYHMCLHIFSIKRKREK